MDWLSGIRFPNHFFTPVKTYPGGAGTAATQTSPALVQSTFDRVGNHRYRGSIFQILGKIKQAVVIELEDA